jgi:predicted amino acid racemase
MQLALGGQCRPELLHLPYFSRAAFTNSIPGQNLRRSFVYLDATAARNPGLIKAAALLHKQDVIPANTYVVDLGAIRHNAALMAKEADRVGIALYLMTKHYNRNPLITKAAMASGIQSTVGVEFADTIALSRFGLPVGHVGHLVQIPKGNLRAVLKAGPEVMTVFSVDKAKQVSDVAVSLGMVQDLLLRIRVTGDIIYPNEEGGIWEAELETAARAIGSYPGVRIAGVTTFPATLFNPNTGKVETTVNFPGMLRAAERLRGMGFDIKQINSPGASSAIGFGVVAKAGGTHAEPGHALTGTTPQVLSSRAASPEIPALVYVSEVSHLFEGKGYVIGGGFYACETPALIGDDSPYQGTEWRPQAFVGRWPDTIMDQKVPVDKGSFFGRTKNATDYYGGTLEPTGAADIRVGDTAIYGFRPQAFTTRANVAVIDNVMGTPKLIGLFDRGLSLLDEDGYPLADTVDRVRDMMRTIENEQRAPETA